MRYLFFSYMWATEIEQGSGNLTIERDGNGFPSLKELRQYAIDSLKRGNNVSIVFMSWNEFRNKSDYLDFSSELNELEEP